MESLLASTLGPRIDLQVQIDSKLPPALADANQLEMALLNLTVNARDAMPEGGALHVAVGVVRLDRTEAALSGGDYIKLSVQDTGTGMDADTLTRCIEPFFSTKGIGRGTGLGLSMVHGLAAQLSGDLKTTSRVGEGTTIELLLPTTTGSAPRDEVDDTVAVPKSSGTALVVDDEDLVRASTVDMLEEIGFNTIALSSAAEALQVLQQQVVELVVTDHLMPGMTGTQLATIIRAEYPKTRVLIVSGYAEAIGLDSSFERLTKPFRQAELMNALAEKRDQSS
jgi:CheY-like chemotaxis protein/anti-sigma regulatory factor (Ser/Thr protein kinase)